MLVVLNSQSLEVTHNIDIEIANLDKIDANGKEMDSVYHGSQTYIKTKFQYFGYNSTGQNIPLGCKAKLIFLNTEEHDELLTEQNVASLAIILNEQCFSGQKRYESNVKRLIVCNNITECKLFYNAFHVLKKPTRIHFSPFPTKTNVKDASFDRSENKHCN